MDELTKTEPKKITARYARGRQKEAVRKAQALGEGTNSYKNQKHMDILSFNAGAEDAFVLLVAKMIERNGGNPVEVGRVLQKAAFKLDVSTMTAKRYLLKHSDDEAELRVFGKVVMMNPNFKEEGEDEE